MNKIVLLSPDELQDIIKNAVADALSQARPFSPEFPKYMNEKQAGEYLGISPNTLRIWRGEKKGPIYHKIDKSVRYSREELDVWMKSRQTLTIDALEMAHGKVC